MHFLDESNRILRADLNMLRDPERSAESPIKTWSVAHANNTLGG